MIPTVVIGLVLGVIIAFIWGQPLLSRLQREQLKKKSFPLRRIVFLEKNCFFYPKLPKSLQKQLQGHIQVFLAEKQFIGCQGFKITEEVKLAIAAQACLLLLNEREEYYPKLYSILVYPSIFIVNRTTSFQVYLEEEQKQILSGESWGKGGQVILSWDDIRWDIQNWKDGRNVVLHEFAHQLDQEDGQTDGVPILKCQSDYLTWAKVFNQEYHKFCNQIEKGKKTVINEYGATNSAEFFAVATETFFEKPQQLYKKHPQLYEVLKNYYKLDPLMWN